MSKRAPRATFSNSIAGFEPGGQGRGGRSRHALLVGTALGASILVFSLAQPGTARANDECGLITVGSNDIAVCSPAGNTYPNGIIYTDSSGNALSLIIEPGVIDTDLNSAIAVYALNTAGDAVIVAYGGDVISGPNYGLFAVTHGPNLALVESGASVSAFGIGVGAYADPLGGGAAEVLNAGPVYSSEIAVFAKSLGGYGHVQNSGALNVVPNAYGASGYGIYVGAKTGIVSNTGNISVSGTFNTAAGIQMDGVNSYLANSGAVTVNNGEGLASGLVAADGGGGSAIVRNTGDLNVVGYSHAKGIYAYGVTASVSSTGNISATSIDGSAFGARVNSFGGYANLALDGTIYAHSEGVSYAYGAKVTGTGNGTFQLTGGSVYAKSDLGTATGVGVYMLGGSAHVDTRGGTVSAYGQYATGIGVSGSDVTVYSGAVYAKATELTALGIAATATAGDVTIRGYGDITAIGYAGTTGVRAAANDGAVAVVIDGNVTVTANEGGAFGVFAQSVGTYDTYVRVNGNVSVSGAAGSTGILEASSANATAYVAGNVYVHVTNYGSATGVNAIAAAGYDATVDVTGNVIVRGDDSGSAIGVRAAGYNETVVVGGNVTAYGVIGANGIEALSQGGNSTVVVGGIVTATSAFGEAVAVTASSYAGHTTNVSVGGVAASGYVAYGMTTGGNGQSIVYVGSGGVDVSARYKAVGIAAVSGESSSSLTVVGPTTVTSTEGAAYGLENSSPLSSSLNSQGDVTVHGATYALGLKDSSGQNAYVQENGNVTVTASGGVAKGVVSVGSIYATANLSGAINVTSTTSNAYGVVIDGAGGATGKIAGSVTAHGSTYALGVLAESGLGNVSLTIDGAVGAYATGNAIGVRAISYVGTSSLVVTGPTTVTSTGGSAIGLENASPNSSALTSDGDVTVQGATYALGLKDSSGQNSYLNEVGNITVTATGANAVAEGLISVGSNYANANLSGAISVTSEHGAAYGVALSGYEGVNGQIAGSVSVQAHNYALGVLAESGDGNVNLTGGGDVSATSLYTNATAVRAISPFTVGVALGNISATGLYGATGVTAIGSSVDVSLQSVNAHATFGNATGVYAYGNTTTVNVAGNVTATSAHYDATGIRAYSYEAPLSVTVGGTTVATARYGNAIGVKAIALGYYPGTVTVTTGDVHASGYTGAIGVLGESLGVYNAPYYYEGPGAIRSNAHPDSKGIQSLYGYYSGNAVTITTGNVTATTINGTAIGVEAIGYTTTTHVAGSVNASSSYGNAFGVVAVSFNTGNVTVDGDVHASTGGYSEAYGVYARGYGPQLVTVHGNVSALSGRAAVGVFVNAGDYYSESGNASVHVDGNVYANGVRISYGVETRSTGTTNVYVGGDVTARSTTGTYAYTTGVGVHSYGDATVHVGGNVMAYAANGETTGVDVETQGSATISVGGAVQAVSLYEGEAFGFYANVAGTANISAGSVVAVAPGNAYGVLLSAQEAYINIAGNVTAISQYGTAQGITVLGYNESSEIQNRYANVTVGGNVYARAFDGDASGVMIQPKYVGHVQVYGNVTAIGTGNATGVSVNTIVVATTHVGGNVYAYAGEGTALGVGVSAGKYATAEVIGNVTAHSAHGNATGVSGYSEEFVGISVYGDVRVSAPYGNAIGVTARTVDGPAFVYVGGNVHVTGYGLAKGVYSTSPKYNHVSVYGQVSAYASNGNAFGVETIGAANINLGGVSAVAHNDGGFAYGVDATTPEGGDVYLTVANDVYARDYGGRAIGILGTVSGDFGFYGNIGGNVTAIADGDATGAQITSGGNISLAIGGDLTAVSYAGNATGAYLYAAVTANLTVGGNVTVQALDTAVGIDIKNADFIAYADVGGSVHVVSQTGNATGVELYSPFINFAEVGSLTVMSPGDARGIWELVGEENTAIVDGDLTVVSTAGNATGIYSNASVGSDVFVGGNVLVQGFGRSTGVSQVGEYFDARLLGNLTVTSATGAAYGFVGVGSGPYDSYVGVGGSTYVKGVTRAVGVQVNSTGNVEIYTGAVTAIATDGGAYGIDVTGCATVRVTTTGDVYANGLETAYGVRVFSGTGYDALVSVGGNATAISTEGNAIAVFVRGGDYASANVSGSVFAHGEYTTTGVDLSAQYGEIDVAGGVVAISNDTTAIGVKGHALYDMSITVGGNVASFAFGNATGIDGDAQFGHLTIDVGGNVYATSYAGYAVGIKAYSNKLDTITVGGGVHAYGLDGATGIDLTGAGPVKANITGVVSAISTEGEAIGVYAHTGSYVALYLGGASAHGAADAFGVYSNAPGANYLTVTGDVTAISTGANAEGVSIRTPSVVTVDIAGNVLARAPDTADGIYIAGGSSVSVTAGSVYARSYNGTAYGIDILASGDINANVTHDVTARAYGNATGISGNSLGGNVTLGAGGNVIAIVSGSDGYAYGIRARAPAGYAAIHGGVNTYAYARDGAFGLDATGATGAYVGATGNVRAVSEYNAIGVNANSHDGGVTVDIGGVATAISTYYAVGIRADSYYGDVNVTAGGAVAVSGKFSDNSFAIAIQAYSTQGNVSVTTTGDVYASGGRTVRGVNAVAYDNTKISIGGNVTALGYYLAATGVYTDVENGNAVVTVAGNVYAASQYGQAYGAIVRAHDGVASANITGTVEAKSGRSIAIGVEVSGLYASAYVSGNVVAIAGSDLGIGVEVTGNSTASALVHGNVYASGVTVGEDVVVKGVESGYASIYGDVTARATDGNATAVSVSVTDGDGQAYVGGNVLAVAYGNATGVNLTATGNGSITVMGSVGAYAHYGNAFGVKEVADASVYIGGNAIAVSDLSSATAVYLKSTGAASINVGQNVYAKGAVNATGVYVHSTYAQTVYVGGNVTVLAGSGTAIGVDAIQSAPFKYNSNSQLVHVGGDVTAISTYGSATGVLVHDYYVSDGGTADVQVLGDVTVMAALNAYGVNSQVKSASDTHVDGNVTVISKTGSAYGVLMNTKYAGSVEVDKNVGAYGAVNAYGVKVTAEKYAFVDITGNATAEAGLGNAIAISAHSYDANAAVHVGGNVYAYAPGVAIGVKARADKYATVTVGGSVFARSTAGAATGVYAFADEGAGVSVTGNVKAVALGDAIGVNVYVEDGSGMANVTGNVTAISSQGNATGVLMSADNYGNVSVGGDVFVQAPGRVYGVFDNAYVANISVGGNVVALSTGVNNATGVSVSGTDGVTVNVGGYVYASGDGRVRGVDSFAEIGATNIDVAGNVTAKSITGNATGVYAVSGFLVGPGDITYSGNISVTVGGTTRATSYSGAVYGIFVRTAYDATVKVGDVIAYSRLGYANGVHVIGDSYIGTGNVTAVSYAASAVGVYGSSTGYLGVHVAGSVYAHSTESNAVGLIARSDGDSNVIVTGDVTALSRDGYATGVAIYSDSNSTGHIYGNVLARSSRTTVGVLDYAGNVSLTVDGQVAAITDTGADATGLIAEGRTINVTVGGAYAYSTSGNATGLILSGDYVTGNTTGDVFVKAPVGNATGIRVNAGYGGYVNVSGNVTAISVLGNAIGVDDYAEYSERVSVSGAVTAQTTYGDAIGVMAFAGKYAVAKVGTANAYSKFGDAIGLNVSAVSAGAESTGNVHAQSYAGNALAVQIDAVFAYTNIGGNAVAVSHDGNATAVSAAGEINDSVFVAGSATAYSVNGTATGVRALSPNDVTIQVGSAYAATAGAGNATGLYARGTGVVVGSYGDVFAIAKGTGSAIGIDAAGYEGLSVNVGGNVVAHAVSGNAYGVFAVLPDYDITTGNIVVTGQVEAISKTGTAIGVIGASYGAFSVSVGGGYVYSQNQATGIEVHTDGEYGDIFAGVSSGALFVKSVNDTAYGMLLTSEDGGNVTLGGATGNIVVISGNASAIGVDADAEAGNVNGQIGGSVSAVGHTGAVALEAYASGNAAIGAGGNVSAETVDGYAVGAIAKTSYSEGHTASVTIGGNVLALSYTGDATGVRIGGAYGDVSVTGGIQAIADGGSAYGVRSITSYGANITIGGNTVAVGSLAAVGVDALSYSGPLEIATGNILAVSTTTTGGALGILARTEESGDITTHTDGSIVVDGLYGVGVQAQTTGNVGIYVSGGITAYGGAGSADGVFTIDGLNTSITVGGNVIVHATNFAYGVNVTSYQNGNTSVKLGGVLATSGADYTAHGVNANTAGNISVTVTGNTVAVGGTYGVGVRALSYGGGNIAVSLGNVMVGETGTGLYDEARGVYAETTGNITVDISGSTLVGGELAWGVYSYSTGGGNITIDVGNVTVHQYAGYLGDNSAGILAYTDGNVSLTAGNIDVTGNYIVGVRLSGRNFTPTGNITLTVGNVSTTGDHSPGVYLVTTGANANITVGTSYTTGNYSDGVYLVALDGNGTVTAGNVITKGNHSDGVYLWAYGNASVTVTGTAYTKGDHSDGIYAYSKTGGTTVTANMVETMGDYSQGIHAVAGGAVVVNNGVNVTFGAHSDAVYAKNSGTTPTDTVTVTSGTAITHGDYSDGIYAHGYHATSVTSTTVNTFGNHSTGIYAGSVNGPVTVASGTVYTAGNYSQAIYVVSGGSASVTANMTVTKGDDAAGIDVDAHDAIYVGSHYVRTYGFSSTAIGVSSTNGPVDVMSYSVRTSGDFADGIAANAVYGDVSVASTQVITDGHYAAGINAGTLVGNTTVSSSYVRTNGDSAVGILASAATGAVTVTSGGVVTYGNYSTGIIATTNIGNVAVTSTYAGTHGYRSGAIFGYAADGTVSITSNTVKTFGDYSTGVEGRSVSGNVSVTAAYVATHGYYADGVDAVSTSGNVSVHVGMAKTYGDNAYGAYGYSKTGNVYVGATGVITHGNLSAGLVAYSYAGNASIDSTYVRTYGAHATGLFARAGGDASVVANTVITSGNYSTGVEVEATGNASANSTYVHTAGFHSDGVYVEGGASATVNNAGAVETTGNRSVGIVAVSGAGSAAVTSETVITSGAYADGIESDGYAGASVNNTNAVKTTGYDARGIVANSYRDAVTVTSNTIMTYGKDSLGILAFGNYGDVDVTSTMVYTAGAHAGGIAAKSALGNVAITSDHVITMGDYSTGIYAYTRYGGTATIHSTDVRTYGNGSVGIEGVSYSGLKIYSDQAVTHGNYSSAIVAVNDIGDVLVSTTGATVTYGADSDAIYAQNVKAGNVSVLVGGEISAADGVGVHINAEGGGAYVYNTSRIYGGRGGIVASSATGTTIANYGAITGGHGYAMGVSGGGALVDNHGSIYGYAHFTGGNTTVNNAGRWFAYGDSSFGGAADTFNNTNAVFVAPFSASAVTVNWTGLEVFNNSGLVDLRNGHSGDIFNLGGSAWNATGNSTLGVDVAFSANLTSDKLVVGAVSGTTALAVTDVTPGQVGVINTTGTTVVQGTSGAAGDFTWAGFKKGFIDYELKFFSIGSNVDWNIVALPDNAAFEMLKAPAMAQDFWTRSGDTWSDREQEVRDSMWGSSPPTRGEGWEMWANAVGGGQNVGRSQTFNVDGGKFTEDLTTDSTWGGFQMGGDNWTSKNFLWGFTAGFVDQNSSFHLDKNSFDITGWNVGGYGGFTSGSFFLNGLIKGDWYDVKANMHTVPAIETFQGNTWGAKGETGFRLGGPALYFEPRADLSWTSTHLDNANFPSQGTVFSFGDSTSARGSIGAQIGGQWGSTLPYVGIYAVEEFDGKNRITMISGSGCPSCMTVEDTHPGAYEKAEFGFTTTSWNGLEGFAKGDADFGGHTTGFTGTLGVRWQW